MTVFSFRLLILVASEVDCEGSHELVGRCSEAALIKL